MREFESKTADEHKDIESETAAAVWENSWNETEQLKWDTAHGSKSLTVTVRDKKLKTKQWKWEAT